MCCRSAFTKPIFSRYEMKTAIPPNGVTARCVSRRIKRSSDNSASISRGTGLSVAFGLILLLSQILAAKPTPNFGFPVYTCPMHPEVQQDHPGSCPKCGMTLERKTAIAGTNDAESAALQAMTRRFWIGAALALPVFALAMAHLI